MTAHNGVMIQYFHWYTSPDGKLWGQLIEDAKELADAGITAIWLPPACKGAAGTYDVGYGTYDLYDLGEFDQKGTVRTKYGTRNDYLEAIKVAQENNIEVYADIVLNHKMGGDSPEEFDATPFNTDNRHEPIGEQQPIKCWTHFSFPGRKGKYSEFEWHWWHFNASDYNDFKPEENAVYLFEGKGFDQAVDLEKGNFDYLMGCDMDVNNADVKKELFDWGKWYLDTTGVNGFRFDAVKHVDAWFFVEWLAQLHHDREKKLFAVGEYWSFDKEALKHFIDRTDGNIMLFDTVLHHNFQLASKKGNDYDISRVFDGTLVQENPSMAVTIVGNHDTQPLQALEAVVEDWFKPLAYAMILLRKDGYPCIFTADYYGADYKDFGKDGNEYDIHMPSHKWIIDKFLKVRKDLAFGDQHDYFDHPNCIGWTRLGNENTEGIAVVMSNSEDGRKHMKMLPNKEYYDITEHVSEIITTDEDGTGEFRCEAGSVSVWIKK